MPADGVGASPPSVLVVDDEAAIRNALRLLLEMEGFAVRTAVDGLDALRLVETEPPAVILTDLMMPNLDGWALIERIRAGGFPVRGVIAMSAASVGASRPPAADLFIAKPFDVDQVVASVFALLGDAPDADAAATSGRR